MMVVVELLNCIGSDCIGSDQYGVPLHCVSAISNSLFVCSTTTANFAVLDGYGVAVVD
jgi:hypothetical protein